MLEVEYYRHVFEREEIVLTPSGSVYHCRKGRSWRYFPRGGDTAYKISSKGKKKKQEGMHVCPNPNSPEWIQMEMPYNITVFN